MVVPADPIIERNPGEPGNVGIYDVVRAQGNGQTTPNTNLNLPPVASNLMNGGDYDVLLLTHHRTTDVATRNIYEGVYDVLTNQDTNPSDNPNRDVMVGDAPQGNSEIREAGNNNYDVIQLSESNGQQESETILVDVMRSDHYSNNVTQQPSEAGLTLNNAPSSSEGTNNYDIILLENMEVETLEDGHCDVPGWGESGDLTAYQNAATIMEDMNISQAMPSWKELS